MHSQNAISSVTINNQVITISRKSDSISAVNRILCTLIRDMHHEGINLIINHPKFSFEVFKTVLYAAKHGQYKALTWLVNEKHCSLDVTDNKGNNPLLLAIKNGHYHTAKWLVDIKQCSLDVKNSDGDNPVFVAVIGGHLALLDWLINEKRLPTGTKNAVHGDTPLLVAILYDHLHILKWLVEQNHTLLDIHDDDGDNPELYAVINGNLQILKWLVETKNRSLAIRNFNNTDLICMAAIRKKPEILSWLIQEKNINAEPGLLKFLADDKPLDNIIHLLPILLRCSDDSTQIHLSLIKVMKNHYQLDSVNKALIISSYESYILNLPHEINDHYELILSQYHDISPWEAFELDFNLSLRYTVGPSSRAGQLCLNIISGDWEEEKKVKVKLQLAEALLSKNVDTLMEKDSPLNHNNLAIIGVRFNDDLDSIRRAIQIYFLLETNTDEFSIKIKKRLHPILSLSHENNLSHYSEYTWNQNVIIYYNLYSQFKLRGTDVYFNIHTITMHEIVKDSLYQNRLTNTPSSFFNTTSTSLASITNLTEETSPNYIVKKRQ